MILAKGVECILCNINGVSNILIGQGRIEEMVVVARKEYAALDHLGDPLLMKHEGIVIGKAQIEQRRLAGDYKMEAVVRGSSLETLADLETLLAEDGGSVELLHLVDAGDTRCERDCAEPVAAGIGQAADRALEELLAAKSGDVPAVCKSLAEADKVCLEAVEVVTAGDIKTEACADVVDYEDDAVLCAELTNLLPVAVCGKLVVKEVAVEIGSRDKRGYLALVLGDNSLERGDIVPVYIDVVATSSSITPG